MSPKSSSSTRIIFDLLRPSRQRPSCDCLHSRNLNRKISRQSRHVSSATPQLSEMEVDPDSPPRPSQTPVPMTAYRPKPPRPDVKPIKINTDQRRLDNVYVQFLGRGGDKMLSDETKWIAITNKSFDSGRRGFNDRLAFFGTLFCTELLPWSCVFNDPTGKRILELQCSLGLLSVSNPSNFLKGRDKDPHGREPFQHPAIESVECLLGGSHTYLTHHKSLANLAAQYGIPEVVRWRPRDVSLSIALLFRGGC